MTQPPLPTGIAELLFHPPISALATARDQFGPYQAGSHELVNWGWDNGVITPRLVSQTVGVIVQLSGSIPIGWGFRQGWVSNDGQSDESSYEPPLAQLVTQHQLRDGSWITTQRAIVDGFPRQLLWEVAAPGRVGLFVAPRLAFDLFYYIVV